MDMFSRNWWRKRNLAPGAFSTQRFKRQLGRRNRKISLVALVGFLAIALGYAKEARPYQSERWREAVALARQEAKVVIYGSGGIDRYRLYKNRFEATFPGIKVNYLPMGSGQITSRIMAERRAGKYIPDIALGGAGGSTVLPLRSKGALQPVKSAFLLPEVLDKSKWFKAKHWFMDKDAKHVLSYALTPGTIAAYNTNLVNPKQITSYKDLLDDRWRGKIVSRDVRARGPGGGTIKFVYTNPDLGPDFIKKLYGEMDITLSRNLRQMVDWLAQGRFAFLLFSGLDIIDRAREQGLPVDVLNLQQMKEGYPLTSGWNSMLLMNPAPHPNAARVFINWLLSREGQTAFERIMKIASLRTDTTTKAGLRGFLIPKEDTDYMVVSLEKYWHLNSEIRALLATVIK